MPIRAKLSVGIKRIFCMENLSLLSAVVRGRTTVGLYSVLARGLIVWKKKSSVLQVKRVISAR
jgi:hypothetical protein